AVPAEITPHKNNLIQAPLSALTTGQDKRELNVVPELAITGQREHIGEHDVTLIF
ncbi:activating signal cointegrator 1 complex subunit 2, partial [Biomphalaria glabrata]